MHLSFSGRRGSRIDTDSRNKKQQEGSENVYTTFRVCVSPPRETHVRSRRVSDAGQRRFHCPGAQQSNAKQQKLFPEKERHQVSARLSLLHTHTRRI